MKTVKRSELFCPSREEAIKINANLFLNTSTALHGFEPEQIIKDTQEALAKITDEDKVRKPVGNLPLYVGHICFYKDNFVSVVANSINNEKEVTIGCGNELFEIVEASA